MKIKRLLLTVLLTLAVAIAVFMVWLYPRHTVPILAYHSIGYGQGSFFVSPQSFFKQMDYLKKNGYQVISLDELVQNIQLKIPPKPKQVVITFDDGYKDNFIYVYPVLKKFEFPATIFVITDYVDAKDPGFMNWNEIVQVSRDGIAIGSHSKSHYLFDKRMDVQQAMEELIGSKKNIESKIGRPVEYFCYSSGAFCDKAKLLVKQAGYKGACTTNRGFVKFNRDVYELKRIKVTNGDAIRPFSFWFKLSGYYTVFKKSINPS